MSPYPTNPEPYFPDSFDWSKEMKDIMRNYNELYKQIYGSYLEIKRLEKSKVDEKAADL